MEQIPPGDGGKPDVTRSCDEDQQAHEDHEEVPQHGVERAEGEERVKVERVEEQHGGKPTDHAAGGDPAGRRLADLPFSEAGDEGGGHDERTGVEGQKVEVESSVQPDVVVRLPRRLADVERGKEYPEDADHPAHRLTLRPAERDEQRHQEYRGYREIKILGEAAVILPRIPRDVVFVREEVVVSGKHDRTPPMIVFMTSIYDSERDCKQFLFRGESAPEP